MTDTDKYLELKNAYAELSDQFIALEAERDALRVNAENLEIVRKQRDEAVGLLREVAANLFGPYPDLEKRIDRYLEATAPNTSTGAKNA